MNERWIHERDEIVVLFAVTQKIHVTSTTSLIHLYPYDIRKVQSVGFLVRETIASSIGYVCSGQICGSQDAVCRFVWYGP
jgi:hypothetical protein